MDYKNLPTSPGVYLFKDIKGKVLYVGKAINLRERVKSYFSQPQLNLRIRNLLNEAKKIDFFTAFSEVETLLLEAKLIKGYQPKFNVRLKDDKRYLYVAVSKETFPRIYLIRAPEKTKEPMDWFGPFPSSQALKEILRLTRRLFPYRSCRHLSKKACLYYHLKLCPGICLDQSNKEEYRDAIRKIKLFFNGKLSLVLNRLNKEMVQFSQQMKFEEANKRKKQIQTFQSLLKKFKKIPEDEVLEKQLNWLRKVLIKYQRIDPILIRRLEAFDIANLGRRIVVGSMIVFINGEPETSCYRQFKIKNESKGDPLALKEILLRRLKHKEWLYPQLIIVDGGKSQVSAAVGALREKGLISQIAVLGLAKKTETIVVPIIEKGVHVGWKQIKGTKRTIGLPIIQFARDEAHRFSQKYYKKLHQKAIFQTSGPKQELTARKKSAAGKKKSAGGKIIPK